LQTVMDVGVRWLGVYEEGIFVCGKFYQCWIWALLDCSRGEHAIGNGGAYT